MQKMQTINDTVPLIGEVMNSLVESQQLTSQLQQRVSNLEFNENNLLHNIAELEKQLMESRNLYAQLLGSYSRIVEAQSTSPVAQEPEYQRLSSQSIPAHASSEYARFNTALQRPVGLTPPPRQQAQAAESQAVPAAPTSSFAPASSETQAQVSDVRSTGTSLFAPFTAINNGEYDYWPPGLSLPYDPSSFTAAPINQAPPVGETEDMEGSESRLTGSDESRGKNREVGSSSPRQGETTVAVAQ